MHSNQKKILFTTWEGGGNVPPVLSVARQMAERGHHVIVLTEPCLQETVESLGLSFMAFKNYFNRTDRSEDLLKDWNATPLNNPAFDNVFFGPTEIVTEEVRDAIIATSADLVVADCLHTGTLFAAESLNVPRAILFHMPELLPGPNRPPGVMGLIPGTNMFTRFRDRLLGVVFNKIMNKYLGLLNDTRSKYGLKPMKNTTDFYHQADLRLIQTNREFDFPIDPNPGNVVYSGPVLDDPDWTEAWQSPWPEDDKRPLVVVSLSSTYQNQYGAIQNCIDALGQLDVRGLVTLGLTASSQEFRTTENVKLVSSAPHSQIFPMADLVITHAGHGTIIRALSNDLPVISLPMGRDQNDNAVKVEYRGAGLRLNPKAKPNKIVKAVQKVLGDPAYKKQASRLGKVIRADASSDIACVQLEGLMQKKDVVTEVV